MPLYFQEPGYADTFGVSLRVKVMDDDAFQKDRLIGWLCFRLDRFPQGLRLFPLKGADSKPSGGSLLVDSKLTQKD